MPIMQTKEVYILPETIYFWQLCNNFKHLLLGMYKKKNKKKTQHTLYKQCTLSRL